MAARTAIGEVGVHAPDGRYVLLRPSLEAISSLGTPTEIVSLFARVMGEPGDMMDALAVLYACAGDEDVADLFGWWDVDGYAAGVADPDHIVPLARSLLEHGVVGVLPSLPRRHDQEQGASSSFDARDYVAIGVAHLGLAEDAVWSMTMTSLAGALRAKFPPDAPGARAPTIEEHDALMDWMDRVEAARAKKQGVH